MRIKFIIVILFMGQCLYAHNNYFIPGDAFFSSNAFRYNEDKKELTVHYTFLKNSIMTCGHFGFRELKISNVSEKEYLKLILAYKTLRNIKINIEDEEFTKTSPTILIYNKDFDLFKNNILLRYNEGIMKIQKKLRHHALYDEVRGKGLAEKNWSDSLEVKPLKIKEAKLTGAFMGEDKAVQIDRKDIKFVVIPPSNLVEVAQQKDNIEFYVLDKVITKYSYKKGKLKEKKKPSESK